MTPVRDPLELCPTCHYLNHWCICEPTPGQVDLLDLVDE
jgi:hypothetical protein